MMEITLNPEKLPAAKKYVYDRLADGRFRPKVAKIFPFAQTIDAISSRMRRWAKW
jgi:NADPH:quinone reductase-like Zn-dependent oxidoreductase